MDGFAGDTAVVARSMQVFFVLVHGQVRDADDLHVDVCC